MQRRDLLGSIGAVALAAAAGCQESAADETPTPTATETPTESDSEGTETAESEDDSVQASVTFVRNVEEVRGHLTSSVALLNEDRPEDAALHAGHGSDYYAPVLTPLRDEDPELATDLRGHLTGLDEEVESSTASEYETYVNDEVFPLLTDAVEAVVDSETRNTQSFDVRVMNALADRIADEYSAAVPEAGTIDLVGEYWDGRGFLTRIEERYDSLSDFTAGSETLDSLRTEMEDIESAETVVQSTLSFRVETTAAVPLPGARIDGESEAVTYLRNLEELRGHFESSVTLVESDNESAAGLHAGHGADYVATLLPAVEYEDSAMATELLDQLLGVEEYVDDGATAYPDHINDEVLPAVDEIPAMAVPGEYTDSTAVSAGVIVELAHRVDDEYSAAVTDDEVIELYGEYWDARGFLTRMEERFSDIESDIDGETADAVSSELETLRTELETTATPDDVSGSVEALDSLLGDTAVEP